MRKYFYFLSLSFFLAACAQPTIQTSQLKLKAQKNVMLLHGSHFDAAVWDQVISDLGYDYHVEAYPLAGRQKDENPSLKEMAQDMCDKMREPAVLVGHSFGGVVANQMVGICPEKIQQIVYITALVPLNGEKPFEKTSKADEKTYSKIAQFKKDRIYPKPANQFFSAMDPTISKKSIPKKLKLYSESYAAGAAPLEFDATVYDKIPKSYIYAEKDTVITLETQKKFTSRTPMVKTTSISSGHLPMLSKPEELVRALRETIIR